MDRGLRVHLWGHFLLFDGKSAPAYAAAASLPLLCIAVALEAGRLAALRWLSPVVPLWLLTPLYLGLALLSIRFVAGVRLSQMGFGRWRDWSPTERSYFVQLLIIANVVFPVVFAGRLRMMLGEADVWRTVWNVFVPYLFFGFYQEVVYRGLLQTELVRRWGPMLGILASNVLYTFGPLHSYYFLSRSSLAIPMFASIFAIGLFFGVLLRRSGNLWIVAVIHGIGNSYIVGSLGTVR